MKTIKLTMPKNGKGWYLDVEGVINQAPLTALELLNVKKAISLFEEELLKEVSQDSFR